MRIAILLAIATLGACGSDDAVKLENASVNDVAKELRKQDSSEGFVNPGKWRQTVTLLSMEAPGMPPQVAQAMKRQTGQSQVHEVCLTPEQANHPREDIFSGADKNCRYEHFEWGGGKVDLKMLCTHPEASQMMELTGGYQPNSYQMAMTATSKGDSPAERMILRMRVDADRVGECDSTEG